MDRIAIFIDGSNILYTLKDLGWFIDWIKVRDYYAKKHNLVSANFYRAYHIPPTIDEKKFSRFMATSGFALIEKQLKKIYDHKTGKTHLKGNLDIELVVDVMASSHLFDIMVLFSGDGDFVPMIRSLKSKGKIVKVVSSKGSSAIELLQVVGMDYDDLNDLRPIFEHKDRDKRTIIVSKKEVVAPRSQQSPIKTVKPEVEEIVEEDIEKIELEQDSNFPSIGDQFETSLTHGADYGIFVKNKWGIKMLLPASELGIKHFIPNVRALFNREDRFKVEVVNVDTNPTNPESKARLIDSDMKEIIEERYLDSIPDLPDVGATFELKVDGIQDYGLFFENQFSATFLLPIHSIKKSLRREFLDLKSLFNKGDVVPLIIESVFSENDRKLTAKINNDDFINDLRSKLDSEFDL